MVYNSIYTKTLQLSSPCCRCTALPVLITLKTLSSTPYFNKQRSLCGRGGRRGWWCGWRRGWRLLVRLVHPSPNGNGTMLSWFWKQRYNHNIAVHHIHWCVLCRMWELQSTSKEWADHSFSKILCTISNLVSVLYYNNQQGRAVHPNQVYSKGEPYVICLTLVMTDWYMIGWGM